MLFVWLWAAMASGATYQYNVEGVDLMVDIRSQIAQNPDQYRYSASPTDHDIYVLGQPSTGSRSRLRFSASPKSTDEFYWGYYYDQDGNLTMGQCTIATYLTTMPFSRATVGNIQFGVWGWNESYTFPGEFVINGEMLVDFAAKPGTSPAENVAVCSTIFTGKFSGAGTLGFHTGGLQYASTIEIRGDVSQFSGTYQVNKGTMKWGDGTGNVTLHSDSTVALSDGGTAILDVAEGGTATLGKVVKTGTSTVTWSEFADTTNISQLTVQGGGSDTTQADNGKLVLNPTSATVNIGSVYVGNGTFADLEIGGTGILNASTVLELGSTSGGAGEVVQKSNTVATKDLRLWTLSSGTLSNGYILEDGELLTKTITLIFGRDGYAPERTPRLELKGGTFATENFTTTGSFNLPRTLRNQGATIEIYDWTDFSQLTAENRETQLGKYGTMTVKGNLELESGEIVWDVLFDKDGTVLQQDFLDVNKDARLLGDYAGTDGNLVLGGDLILNLLGTEEWAENGVGSASVTLWDVANLVSGTFDNILIDGLPNGYVAQLANGTLNLRDPARVPEPGTWGMCLLGGVLLFLWRKSRKRG
ncbi:MAG: PEP-CTERM sorting domain-containing protein [Planctomycetia bacterium]|nr:PEP-CTERM sorting domain-containing protein [Planctomycetia bacterium]